MRLFWPLVVAFVVVSLWFVLRSRAKRADAPAPAPAARQPTILVLLPSLEDPMLIDNLFKFAEHPLRVFVALGCYSAPQPNVRCLKNRQPFGDAVARQEMMKHLYDNEDFVLCLDPCVWLLQRKWDSLLVEECKPKRVLSYWATADTQTRRESPCTFPGFDRFEDNEPLPLFKARYSSSRARRSFEIKVGTFECVFGRAADLAPLFRNALPFLRRHEEDWLLTLHFFNSQIKIFTPSFHFCYKTETPRATVFPWPQEGDAALRQVTANALQHLLVSPVNAGVRLPLYVTTKTYSRPSSELWLTLGVDLAHRQAAGCAVFGLFGNYTEHDILSRFESLVRFETLRTEMNFIV